MYLQHKGYRANSYTYYTLDIKDFLLMFTDLTPRTSPIIIPILQKRKVRPREVRSPAQGHLIIKE